MNTRFLKRISPLFLKHQLDAEMETTLPSRIEMRPTTKASRASPEEAREARLRHFGQTDHRSATSVAANRLLSVVRGWWRDSFWLPRMTADLRFNGRRHIGSRGQTSFKHRTFGAEIMNAMLWLYAPLVVLFVQPRGTGLSITIQRARVVTERSRSRWVSTP